MSLIQQVRTAISNLNPNEIRESAERPVRIILQARSPVGYRAIEDYLAPAEMSPQRRSQALNALVRADGEEVTGKFQFVFFEDGTAMPEGWTLDQDAFDFDYRQLERLVSSVIQHRDDYSLALARVYPPFRDEVVARTIHRIAKENAMFSLMTALPNVVPTWISLPWAFGEFASDTTVLTVNQIRMAFLVAAASDRPVGYKEQRSEIGSIMAGAWGWRAIARELAGKIPLGGGLVPKAAISYAGTYVVGLSLGKLYRVGYGLTRKERKEALDSAFTKGKEVAGALLSRLKSRGKA
jgi:hypothetical protein